MLGLACNGLKAGCAHSSVRSVTSVEYRIRCQVHSVHVNGERITMENIMTIYALSSELFEELVNAD